MKKTCHSIVIFILAAVLMPSSSSHAALASGPQQAETRLARQLAGSALTILRIKPLSPQALQTAAGIMALVGDIAPDEVENWRLALDIADLAEDEQLQQRAIREIVRLDPADDVARLRRLMELVEEAQTVEERIAVYERLLAPQRIDKLGKAVASRLAQDYALLLRREGRVAAFGEQLARAVELDPSNRAAAALATGFFQDNVDDPYSETELLVNLFLADPTTIDVQTAIARIALGTGAYDGAARMYALVNECRQATDRVVPTEMLADHAIALWGAGRVDDALALINLRQQEYNAAAQVNALKSEPGTTPLDVANLTVPMPHTIAAVRAAIQERQRDPHAGESLRDTLQNRQRMIQSAGDAEKPPTPKDIATAYLEMAWLALWLGRDADLAASYVQQAQSRAPLDDDARARFDGWMAYRRGDLDTAARFFADTSDEDHAAIIGRACVLRDQGQTGAAARLLLRVARERPGTLMGVWSAQMLFSLVGQRAPLSDTARRINDLIASIPEYITRFPNRPAELLSMRVHAEQATFGPDDPIIINIEVMNNSRLPLAISPEGPIHSKVALIPTLRIAQPTKLPKLGPIIVDIDRRLRLEPKQRIIVPVDLRQHAVGGLLQGLMLSGSFVRVRVVWNFKYSAARTFEPALLGGETDTMNFRVNGVRVSLGWVEQAMRDIEVMDQPDDVTTLIMLTHLPNYTLGNIPPEELRVIEQKLPDLLSNAFAVLDPAHQAVVLMEMTASQGTQKLLDIARASDNRLVKVAFLLSMVQSGDDPMIAAGLRSDDPLIRDIALQLQRVAQMNPGVRSNQPAQAPGR